MHKCINCERTDTHKIKAKDGLTIYACDEHLKGFFGCTEIPPLKTRIVKNKFKLALALLLTTNVAWVIFFLYRFT